MICYGEILSIVLKIFFALKTYFQDQYFLPPEKKYWKRLLSLVQHELAVARIYLYVFTVYTYIYGLVYTNI